jgi:hypothetical protein
LQKKTDEIKDAASDVQSDVGQVEQKLV